MGHSWIARNDRGDLFGPVLQHGHSNVAFIHRHPLVTSTYAGWLACTRRNKLGTHKRDVKHDAGDLRFHLARQCAGQHVIQRTHRNDSCNLGSTDAGLQGRAVDRLKQSESDDRTIDRGSCRIHRDGSRLPGAA